MVQSPSTSKAQIKQQQNKNDFWVSICVCHAEYPCNTHLYINTICFSTNRRIWQVVQRNKCTNKRSKKNCNSSHTRSSALHAQHASSCSAIDRVVSSNGDGVTRLDGLRVNSHRGDGSTSTGLAVLERALLVQLAHVDRVNVYSGQDLNESCGTGHQKREQTWLER